ncbi:post-gpi attachment to proteins factor 2 [Plakobranchus ocellatus]|uniref:Post-gpi attachment to proteins factor 2 n=1 Tax=Plakobranchus ocellatus TaxID=259542 RepID=A0AAV3YNX4_9GAST|nr:post-gpi attachment to proteins factor 2 [Plakobranchus ocellatus]
MAKIVCGLPLFATFFCVLWSLMYDFKASTATHCKVPNYLPSISAAIGGFTPQRYVWRICIGLHATPRFMIAVAYYSFHTNVHVGKHNELYKALAALASLLHIIEVGSLVGLTYISSTENHDLHELLFISFMAGAILYMGMTIYLFSWGRSHNGTIMTNTESTSLFYKKVLCGLNVSIFILSVYIFFRHNWFCEPGVYTFFAAGEYLVVVTNILFHATAALDFRPGRLSLLVGKSVMYLDDDTLYPETLPWRR